MYKQIVYRHGHKLANKFGVIRKSRYVLYKKLNGIAGNCNWCGIELTWKTLCADHLDSNIMNDTASNLVGSCRGCNANRSDGTGYGRVSNIICSKCKCEFKPKYRTQLYCGVECAIKSRPKRGTKSKHGTRTRYHLGCNCIACHEANLKYSREFYSRRKNIKLKK